MSDIADRLRALADEVAALEAPTPPAPEPPAPAQVGRRMLNMERIVAFETWSAGVPYERHQRLDVLSGVLPFRRRNWSQKTTDTFRPAKTYTLLIDGAALAECAMAEGQERGEFVVDPSRFTGWLTLDIGGLSDGETCPVWFAWAGGSSGVMPVCTGSYDVASSPGANHEHVWLWKPARYAPKAHPLPPRDYQYTATPTTDVRVDLLVPGTGGNVRHACVSTEGVVSSFNRQAYFFDDLTRKFPRMALMDGPRGVGTLCMPTHIDVGRATQTADPNSAPMLNVYVTDPWRLMRVSDSGHVTTLAGYRHRGMPSLWTDEPGASLELVGDWSAIPEDRRGFHELWGMAWDSDTLKVGGDPIDGREPHLIGPACVVADSQNNRVCRIEFDPRSHDTPAKVTEFWGGNDPWDVVAWRDEFIVSERAANRIVALDKAGNLKRVVIQRDPSKPGDAVLRVGNPRKMVGVGSVAELQAQPCLGPEGLFVQDDWLYFGSFVQRQIKRVHLVDGRVELFLTPVLDGNSAFIKFALSDGTFGPRGSAWVQTWSLSNSAHQGATLPDGSRWTLTRQVPWGSAGYGSAVGVGGGRLYVGTSEYGLRRYSVGPAWNRDRYQAEAKTYEAARLDVIHDPLGFSAPEVPPYMREVNAV